MSFDVNKISEGLNKVYKSKPTKFAKFTDKVVNADDVKGSNSFDKINKSLKIKEENNKDKQDKYNVSFKEDFTLNRKYLDEIFNSKNVNETVLLINSMEKRAQELRGYLLSNLVSRREEAEKELQNILYVFDVYADKIDLLVENGVLQRSDSSNNLFRID